MPGMGRREFITLLGGAASWPFTAHAQQPAMPVVGYLDAASALERAYIVAAFRQGLAETGYIEGQNLAIEYRWAEGDYGRLSQMATELVNRKVSLIVTPGAAAGALAAKNATSALLRALRGRVATLRASIFLPTSWWQSGSASCANWCLLPFVWGCS